MSFLLKGQKDKYLFSGDIILGTPSTVVENLLVYMNTLKKLRDTPEYKFDYVLVTHSLSL